MLVHPVKQATIFDFRYTKKELDILHDFLVTHLDNFDKKFFHHTKVSHQSQDSAGTLLSCSLTEAEHESLWGNLRAVATAHMQQGDESAVGSVPFREQNVGFYVGKSHVFNGYCARFWVEEMA